MTNPWQTVRVSEVRQGDRIRLSSGTELLVSRIEPAFFGSPNLVAFIEDTPARWFKQPMMVDTEVEVSRAG